MFETSSTTNTGISMMRAMVIELAAFSAERRWRVACLSRRSCHGLCEEIVPGDVVDHRPDDLAATRPRAGHEREAVDVGGLLGDSTSHLGRRATGAPFDQHVDSAARRTTPSRARRRARRRRRRAPPAPRAAPPALDRRACRRGAVLRVVGEHTGHGQAGGVDEVEQLLDVVVGLAREAGEERRAQGDARQAPRGRARAEPGTSSPSPLRPMAARTAREACCRGRSR